MAGIKYTIVGTERIAEHFQRAREEVQAKLAVALWEAELVLLSKVKDNLSGDPQGVRTGMLRRSAVAERPEVTPNGMVGVVGVNAVYAALQEFGGDVEPRVAVHLTVPLEAAMTARGVARFTAREFIDNPWLLGFDRSVTLGNLLLGVVKGGPLTPVFALALRVRIPPHKYMHLAFEDTRERMLGIIQKVVDNL